MAKAPPPQRGEIWTVQFDPSLGAEIRKVKSVSESRFVRRVGLITISQPHGPGE